MEFQFIYYNYDMLVLLINQSIKKFVINSTEIILFLWNCCLVCLKKSTGSGQILLIL